MKLIHFFRLIQMSIFQKIITNRVYNRGYNDKMSYDNTYFFCPRIVCNDGFSISLQINNNNYCSSENGYRTLGHTIETVEFGFPNQDEKLLKKYAECPESLTQTVGELPIDVAQQIIDKHGGIDWDKTVSIEEFNTFIKNNTERYIINYDPAIDKDSTIVTTIPIKGNDFNKDKKIYEKD